MKIIIIIFIFEKACDIINNENFYKEYHMKKILLFALITIFAISIISCQKEELLKENAPSQTIEEQEKSPAIKGEKEPETAEDPQVPEEPEEEDKFPYVGEITVTLDSGDIILPAEDEDTKEILIPFPEDFTYGYTEPEIVAPEDFDWGEYVPFVRYETDNYGEFGIYYSYAFLGEDINTLEEGTAFYNNFNDKYKKTFEVDLNDTINTLCLSEYPQFIPLVSESRVIWVSTDASEVGNFYLEKVGTYEDSYTKHNGNYEIYKNDNLESTYVLTPEEYSYINANDGGFLNNKTGTYTTPKLSSIKQSNDYFSPCHINSNSMVSQYWEKSRIYSLDENKLKYNILFDFECEPIGKNYYINQYLNENYLIVTIYSHFLDGLCHNIYLVDIAKKEMTKINGYSFNPLLSPDRKYLIYTNYHEYGQGVNSRCNLEYTMNDGFYIKNLENGETTFYKNPKCYSFSSNQPINWVDRWYLEDALAYHPKADENTIKQTIEFPEDYPTEPFVTPEFVPLEKFEWGDYVPFVTCKETYFSRHCSYFNRAIFTSNCKSLEDAHKVYEKLNNKYLIVTDLTVDGLYCDENSSPISENKELFTDFLCKSKIVYISPEADEMGRLHYVYNSPTDSKYLIYHNWTEYLDIYKDSELKDTVTKEKSPPYIDDPYQYPEKKYKKPKNGYYVDYSNNDICIYKHTEYESGFPTISTLYVYSFEEDRVTYEITLPFVDNKKGYYLQDCIDSRYLLLEISELVYNNDAEWYSDARFHSYLYDIETQKLTFLETYTYNASVSPDLKYLAYTNNFGGSIGYDIIDNMPDGYYIKNLETGETVFFEYNDGYYEIISWINEEKLNALISEEKTSLSINTELLLNGEVIRLGEVFFQSSEKKAVDADLSIAYADMDDDGKKETLIRDSLGDTLVIFCDNTAEYFSFRGMDKIKINGNYSFTEASGDTLIYGEAKLVDNGEKELWRIEEGEETKFFIEEQEVSAEEFKAFDSEKELSLLTFSPFEISRG